MEVLDHESSVLVPYGGEGSLKEAFLLLQERFGHERLDDLAVFG